MNTIPNIHPYQGVKENFIPGCLKETISVNSSIIQQPVFLRGREKSTQEHEFLLLNQYMIYSIAYCAPKRSAWDCC